MRFLINQRSHILNLFQDLWTRSRNKFGICVLLLSLTSCYTPPDRFPVDNSREYNMSFDKVWNNAVEFFAVSNTPIRTIEKDSGIIFAEDDFYRNSEADCGKMGRQKIKDAFGLVRYNVFVKKISANKTKVLVNTDFSSPEVYNPLSRRYERIACESTGEIENNVLDFISNPIQEVIFKFKEREE